MCELASENEWQGRGRFASGERHGVCELAFNAAGERHGMCELTSENGRVVAGSREGSGMGTAWYVLIRHCCFSTATMVARFTLNVTLITQFVLFLRIAVVYKRP
jgi:hypothetical protein